MSSTLNHELLRDPHLVDIVDGSWEAEEMPSDGWFCVSQQLFDVNYVELSYSAT